MKKIAISIFSVLLCIGMGNAQGLRESIKNQYSPLKIKQNLNITASGAGFPSKIFITDYDESGAATESYIEHRYYNADSTIKGGVFDYGSAFDGYAVSYNANKQVTTVELFDAIDSTLNGTTTYASNVYEYDANGIISKIVTYDEAGNFDGLIFENTYTGGNKQPSRVDIKPTTQDGDESAVIFIDATYANGSLTMLDLTQLSTIGDTVPTLKHDKITPRNGKTVTYMDLIFGNLLVDNIFDPLGDIFCENHKTVELYQADPVTSAYAIIVAITATTETTNGGCNKDATYYFQGQQFPLTLDLPNNSLGLNTERTIVFGGDPIQSDVFNYTINSSNVVEKLNQQILTQNDGYIDVRDEEYVYKTNTGITAKNIQTLNVYPNPILGTTVQIDGLTSGLYKIQIFDVAGKLIHASRAHISTQVELPSLAAGAYTLQLSNGNEIFQAKLVK